MNTVLCYLERKRIELFNERKLLVEWKAKSDSHTDYLEERILNKENEVDFVSGCILLARNHHYKVLIDLLENSKFNKNAFHLLAEYINVVNKE